MSLPYKACIVGDLIGPSVKSLGFTEGRHVWSCSSKIMNLMPYWSVDCPLQPFYGRNTSWIRFIYCAIGKFGFSGSIYVILIRLNLEHMFLHWNGIEMLNCLSTILYLLFWVILSLEMHCNCSKNGKLLVVVIWFILLYRKTDVLHSQGLLHTMQGKFWFILMF